MSSQRFPVARQAISSWRRQFDAAERRAAAWWLERSRRERVLLRVGTLVLALALLWTLGLKPALDSISLSQERLPRLRAEAARIDALILEAQTLQRRQSGRVDPSALTPALQASLRRAGLEAAATLDTARIAADSAREAWEVSLSNASAAHVMEWLASLPHLLHLRITAVALSRSQIDGRDRPGQVSGHVFVQPEEHSP